MSDDRDNVYVVLSDALGVPTACGVFLTETTAQEWIDETESENNLHIQATPIVTEVNDE